MAPSFIIIGTQKGGTTSMYEYLIQNPKILSASRKELHFFDNKFSLGKQYYKSRFPIRKGKDSITGESSPYYLFHPEVPNRIYNTLPRNLKFIVLLRNPVYRALSQYKMEVKKGKETLSFKQAIEMEEERLEGSIESLKSGKRNFAHQTYSYLSRGLYFEQLERWFKLYKRSNFLILKSEDFFSNTKLELDKVYDFLEIEKSEVADFPVYNKGSKEKLDTDIKEYLFKYFEEPNRKLYNLLEKNFNWENEK